MVERGKSHDLFATSDTAVPSGEYLNGEIPVLIVDGVYRDPLKVREAALALDYAPTDTYYPGRVASFPPDDPSLSAFIRKVVGLVQGAYLPRLPGFPNGKRLTAVSRVVTDFAIVDRRPSELHPFQTRPHTDAVPVFGLVYLNEEERGGTLFFKPKGAGAVAERAGYQTASDDAFDLCGRIAGSFNRLAIYPGFVPHSGEIAGDWINSGARESSPRLTQRIQFFF